MIALGGAALMSLSLAADAANPIVPGWYADPEIRIFDHRYWIYPTLSDVSGRPAPQRFTPAQAAARKAYMVHPSYAAQTYLDAFSSPDLVHWTKHPRILDIADVKWAAYAVWAPSTIEVGGRYYLFFGANDIQSDNQTGGIGLAVSDKPGGPFRDALGKPLIAAFHNGAQPIDPFVYQDTDGQVYLYYGGWGHCNVVRLSRDLRRIEPFADGSTYKEITPPGYTEGSFVIKRRGVYYLMWSEGDWTGPEYRVAYATGRSPLGPFTPKGVILAQDFHIARGAGHHSVVNVPGTDDWYIVYHRRPLGDDKGDHRQLAIDRMTFIADGSIAPVTMTKAGIAPRPLPTGKKG
ncbi:glycoside hydrolase family 43 protein [Sphingomonas sp. EC-HK361]|uniref:glycoside hydrolase family 43 protein n=1 Tax=Sphingomonas sp. EC-HK361 TaxID=2038397 RepID=UPI001F2326D4|nr:glycoside hydrolase family 43 protein [Sphingomonas sp. EC-HK361]